MNADNLKVKIALAAIVLAVAAVVAVRHPWTTAVPREGSADVPTVVDLGRREAELEAALRGTLAAVRSGHVRTAGLPLGRAWREFESLADAPALRPAGGGPSPRDWFEERRRQFVAQLLEAWPGVRAQIRTGDLGWDDYAAFERSLPPPFQREMAQRARDDRREIEIVRAAGVGGWYLVDTSGATDETSGFGESVREALRRNWPPAAGLKLVFDRPMNGAEAAAAAHVLRVQVREDYADYDFGPGGKDAGSHRVPESVTVVFSDATRRDGPRPVGLPAWDQLPPVTVTLALPEQVKLRRQHQGGLAGFDRFVAEQRAALQAALEGELARRLPER